MRVLIHKPNDDCITLMQEDQNSIYWSSCAELILKKHGLKCAEIGRGPETANLASNYNICLRGSNVESCNGFFEGPMNSLALEKFGISSKQQRIKTIVIFNRLKECVGALNYKRFNVKEIPESRKIITEPYEHIDENIMLRAKTPMIQFFVKIPKDWEVVAYGQLDDGTFQPIIVKNSQYQICGIEIFDFFGFDHFLPNLKHGFYNTFEGKNQFLVERFLIEEIEKHSAEVQRTVTRSPFWPKGFNAALSIRHDYDRFIEDQQLNEILHFYSQHELKSTWFILVDKPPSKYQINAILALGHELSLHTVASSLSEFTEEVKKFRELTGVKAHGFTCHRRIGSSGALGLTHNMWAKQCGLLYGEMHGSCRGLPHPLLFLKKTKLAFEHFFVQNCHFSLDTTTKADGHQLEKLSNSIPIALKNMEHVTLMNHPDIHWTELKCLLNGINFDSVWKETINNVMSFAKSRYDI